MDRQHIRRALEGAAKGSSFISIHEIAKALGVQSETVRANYLKGLDYLPNGHSKLYLIDDVIDTIIMRRKE